MEEITGFDDQIGFFNPFKAVKKATQNIQKNIVKRTPVMPIKKASQSSFFNRLAQRTKMVQAAPIKKAPQSSVFNKLAQRAKMVQAAQIKKVPQKSFFSNVTRNVATAIKRTPTMPVKVAPQKSFFSNIANKLQSLPAAQQAKQIHNLAPSPTIVKQLNPIQRGFLKTDLPYKVIDKNNFGQPKTQFIKNTPYKFDISIDQIEPPVDSGISNYYGK